MRVNFNETENRSSLSNLFCKRGVLENFAKFTEKHLYWSLFLNKVADHRRLEKGDFNTDVFPLIWRKF